MTRILLVEDNADACASLADALAAAPTTTVDVLAIRTTWQGSP